MRTVADRLAAYHNNHCWREMHTLSWNILEIVQDNLRTKLNWCCRASDEQSISSDFLFLIQVTKMMHQGYGLKMNEYESWHL